MTSPGDRAAAPAEGPLQPLALVRAHHLDRSEPVRSWTPLGTVDSGVVADVDGAGAVQPRGAGWHLDWWVGAEDRWHHPSREAAVRQRWVDDTPVVETAMRVPGGDVVHRAYGVRASSDGDGGAWDGAAVVVEVRNDTAVPVALAFAVRPTGLDGPGQPGAIEVDGAVVRVDGEVVAVLSKPPARLAHGSPGAVAGALASGDDLEATALSVPADPGGEVALVVPLPHSATVRVLLPQPVERPGRRPWRRATRPAAPGSSWQAPDHQAVVRGWQAHTRDAARVELPEPVLGSVLAASQRALAVAAHDDLLGDRWAAAHGSTGADAAERAAWVSEVLARSGLVEPLGPIALALAGSQGLRGPVTVADRSDATVALLHAAAPLLGTGAAGWEEDLLGPVAKAVHHLGRTLERDGRTPDGSAAEALGRLAPALRSIGQPEVADEAERLSAALRDTAPDPRPAGGGTAAEAARVRGLLRAGDLEAIAQLLELCRHGAPGALPDHLDEVGVPDGAFGFDAAAVANRAAAVLDAVLVEGADGPVLLPSWPSAWWGQPIEAHGVRTRWGRASFAVRWHGERPALLWEVDSDGDHAPLPALTAPALDPSWRGEGRTGEALLSPVDVPPTLVAIRAPGTAPAPSSASPAAPPPSGPPPAEGESFS